MRRFELGDDLIEAHRRRVDDARPVRAEREDVRVHERAGIETDRAARDEVCAAEREQVRRAGAGADEMHGHGITTRGFVALHWVTVIAGRKACLPPTASRRSTESRVSVPPNLCLRGEHRLLGLEGDGIGDDAAAWLQRGEGLVDQRRLAAAADEDGVRRRQLIERGRSLAGHDLQPRHAKLGGVARGAGGAQRIALDADGAVRGVPQQPLDGDRARAAADVPQQLAGAGRKRRERHRPDLALGDLAVMLEHVVGQARSERDDLGSGARLDLDGDEVQRLDIVEAETVGGR